MRCLLEKLVAWVAPTPASPGDRFITIRNGRAQFDVATYLATHEGQARIERLSRRNFERMRPSS